MTSSSMPLSVCSRLSSSKIIQSREPPPTPLPSSTVDCGGECFSAGFSVDNNHTSIRCQRYGVVVTNKLNIVRFSALKHIKLVTVLRPVYSDATQLNSTRRRVELRRYRHPHWVTTFRTDRWLLFMLWTCRQLDVELSRAELCRYDLYAT